MKFDGDKPSTHARRKLFREHTNADRQWDHLVIPGNAIADVLFEPLGQLGGEIEDGNRALDDLLRSISDASRIADVSPDNNGNRTIN
jgi:hypothetical protein